MEEGTVADLRLGDSLLNSYSQSQRSLELLDSWHIGKRRWVSYRFEAELNMLTVPIAGSARIWRPGQIYTGHLDRTVDT